jgi:putative NIF3 family GTP cyclohydrolase 1 type 2
MLVQAMDPKRGVILMTDEIAKVARLMKVIEALVDELDRQELSVLVADHGIDVTELAKVAIKAADEDVVPFKRWPF